MTKSTSDGTIQRVSSAVQVIEEEGWNLRSSVGEATLMETPARVFAFLSGVGTTAAIRKCLADRGYTAKEHERGWALLHEAAGYRVESVAESDKAVTALNQLAEARTAVLRIAGATLRHRHPKAYDLVFDGLAVDAEEPPVLVVRTFLERMGLLLHGSPDGSVQADSAATATLAARGIGPDEFARLEHLLADAEGYEVPIDDAPDPGDNARQAMLALRAWYEEWSEIAHSEIHRRSYLIRLGLANRRRSKKLPTPAPNPPSGVVPAATSGTPDSAARAPARLPGAPA